MKFASSEKGLGATQHVSSTRGGPTPSAAALAFAAGGHSPLRKNQQTLSGIDNSAEANTKNSDTVDTMHNKRLAAAASKKLHLRVLSSAFLEKGTVL